MDRFGEVREKRERYSELKCKEVINICDGNRLGYITDLEIDILTGRICRIIVTEKPRIWDLLCNPKEVTIDWQDIVRIGDDTILVDPRRKRAQPQSPHHEA